MDWTNVEIETDEYMPEVLEIPVWKVSASVVFPFCKELLEIKDFKDMELLGEARRFDGKVFVIQEEHSGFVPDTVINFRELAHSAEDVKIGTLCEIKDIVRNDDDTYDALLLGVQRGVSVEFVKGEKCDFARLVLLEDIKPEDEWELEKCKVYKKSISQILKEFSKAFFRVVGRHKSVTSVINIDDYEEFCYKAAQFAELEPKQNMLILKCDTLSVRLKNLTGILNAELQYLSVSDKILEDVQKTLSKQQKEMFLREQIRSIQRELGDDEISEADAMMEKLEELAKYMPEETVVKISDGIVKLRKIQPMSPDYQVLRSHIEFLLDLPWEKPEEQEIDLKKVRDTLERDHYAMEKVKERIVEYMAVKTMKNATARSLICLYGPPGTGKTSVARSIAEALGRKYVRISLGGVRDEAEIRGHRKTYVGAMPGRILTAIKNAGVKNPVVLLDEIDKLNSGDFRGDPASALLEVLDKEQNTTFRDNYAEVPFDLSEVLFITTANSLETIPLPLLDRLEVIELSSYTEDEKLQIAKRHLVPKQRTEHGLTKSAVSITDGAILKLINEYTTEAGVRGLERQIAALMRKSICILKAGGKKTYRVNEARVGEMLGAGHAVHRFNTKEGVCEIGAVNGMAWTPVGGALLQVEVNVVDGMGKIEITGLIGDVMKESAQAALSYIRSRASELNVPKDFYKTKDIHIHVPEGATKKDGPSAGVTLTTAIFSALTGTPVKQCVSMTGEITLRGDVLAIGGLKEKSLAALKAGISTIIVPAENHADVLELPEAVRKGVKIVEVRKIDEVFAVALCGKD